MIKMPGGCCAAGRGATIIAMRAPRTATTSIRTPVTPTSVFGWCVCVPLRFEPLAAGGGRVPVAQPAGREKVRVAYLLAYCPSRAARKNCGHFGVVFGGGRGWRTRRTASLQGGRDDVLPSTGKIMPTRINTVLYVGRIAIRPLTNQTPR